MDSPEKISIDDLTIWRHPIRGAMHAVLPPNTSRPNPLALANLVISCVLVCKSYILEQAKEFSR